MVPSSAVSPPVDCRLCGRSPSDDCFRGIGDIYPRPLAMQQQNLPKLFTVVHVCTNKSLSSNPLREA
jgi:hypothetical protein